MSAVQSQICLSHGMIQQPACSDKTYSIKSDVYLARISGLVYVSGRALPPIEWPEATSHRASAG